MMKETNSNILARAPTVQAGGVGKLSLTVLRVLHCTTYLAWQSNRRNLGDEDKENALQNVFLPNACESPERLHQEDDDEPVSIGEGSLSKSAGAGVDEFDTLVVDSDDRECGPSDGSNASRTKELEAFMARLEDIVSSMSRDALGGRLSSSEEEENEDEDGSDTAELYEDKGHASNVFPAMSSTHSRSCVQGHVNSEDDEDHDNSSRSKYMYLQKVPQEGTPHINWPQQALRRVCGHRKIKKMSRSKDNTRMAEMLERLDAALKRSSPYFEDCRKMGDRGNHCPET